VRVFVTGATGQIGRALRKALINQSGIEPFFGQRTLDRTSTGDAVGVDVSDRESFRNALRATRPDVVVHLAGVTPSRHDISTSEAHAVNVRSVAVLAEAMSDFGIGRTILSSSAAVYGDAGRGPFAESAPLAPSSSYARDKVAAEFLLRDRDLNASGETVALRIFNGFGGASSSSLVTRLAESTEGDPVPIWGLDSFVRDYIHIDDVVQALLCSLSAELPARDTVFNIGTGIPTSNRLLIETLLKRGPVHARVTDGPSSYSCADTSLARAHLGFSAERRI